MKFDILKNIKILFPYFFLIVFFYFIYNFYSKNISDFSFIKNFKFSSFFLILMLSLFYLITEALIFKRIAKYFNKDLNFLTSFYVINTTYLFNTFVQFSGLGFRAYFLKKIHNINISNFLVLSIFVILVEFYVFSLIGSLFLIISYIFNYNLIISNFLKIVIYSINIFTLFFFIFNEKIFFFLIKFLNLKKFSIIKKIYLFYEDAKKKELKLFLFKFLIIFFIQFILIFCIFAIGASTFGNEHLTLFLIIATIATDFSFIFALTPYSIGISEAFIYFSSLDMGVTFAQVLFLSNIFRLSTFCIYAIIGPIYFFYFTKKIINT